MTNTPTQKSIVQRFLQWKPFPEEGVLPLGWSLWVEQFQKAKHKTGMSKNQFASALNKEGDFQTVNELCELWSKFTDDQGKPIRDCNLLIFQQGIKPLWEDPANIIGGDWVIRIMRNDAKAEQVWYSLLMTVICGQLTGVTQQEVTGIVISPRDHLTQIYVWNKHSLNSKYKDIMLSFICDSLDVPRQYLRYNVHKKKVYQNANSKKDGKKKNNNNNNKEKSKSDGKHSDDENDNESDGNHNDSNQSEENNEQRDDRLHDDEKPIEEENHDENDNPENLEDGHEEEREIIDPTTPLENGSEPIEYVQQNEIDPNSSATPVDSPVVTRVIHVEEPQANGISMFSISIGFAIFLALLYNLYIIFA